MRTTMKMRDFADLRERANTPQEFRDLAEWCRLRAQLCRSQEARHTAGILAGHYRELSKHWAELHSLYTTKAIEMECQISD